MRIIVARPLIYEAAATRFTLSGREVFAWAPDIIYNPSGAQIGPDLIVHESVHCEQQACAGGPEAWWARYLVDPAFLVSQEVEAYGAQLAFLRAHAKRGDRCVSALVRMAGALSSEMYGRPTSHCAAMRAIRLQAETLHARRFADRVLG